MSVYRLTEFVSPDMDKLVEFAETLRDAVSAAGAESIDVVSFGDGKGLVIAKYASADTMEASTSINRESFGKMIAAGHVSEGSVSGQSGDVVFSF